MLENQIQQVLNRMLLALAATQRSTVPVQRVMGFGAYLRLQEAANAGKPDKPAAK